MRQDVSDRFKWVRARIRLMLQSAMPIIECIPNVSEGRRPESSRDWSTPFADAGRSAARPLVGRIAQPIGAHARRRRRRRSRRRSSRCSTPRVEAIDLRTHQGEHPRIGAVDVVPFVPIEGVTMADCVALAKEVGAAVAERFAVPGLSLRGGVGQPRPQEPRGHPPRRVRRTRRQDGAAGLGAGFRPRRAPSVGRRLGHRCPHAAHRLQHQPEH